MASFLCSAPDGTSYAGLPSSSLRTGIAATASTRQICQDRETLYAQFSPLVQRLIRQYGYTPEMRQDMLGELYYRFHTFLDHYDPARGIPVSAYLVRHLTASAFTYARTQWRHQDREMRLFQEGKHDCRMAESDPTPGWDAALQQSQIAEMLPSLIADLPLRQKQAVILRYYEDRSFEEIGQMLDIKPSSARSLLRHGLSQLRAHIASNASQT